MDIVRKNSNQQRNPKYPAWERSFYAGGYGGNLSFENNSLQNREEITEECADLCMLVINYGK
ncbi:hypothetical protein CS542_04435 [Pedobacter sp. IW39]|nr:hypothetical protein CS542_04435 [Pedobacter sp. IW39]